MSALTIKTAEVFQPLLEPHRYKGAKGGRWSGKSHFMADNLIDDCLRIPGLRVVCIREIQRTLKQSSRQLIADRLLAHGLGERDGFKVFNEVIQTPSDGLMLFQGMQDHNADSIKSLEGMDRAWVEESQTLSEYSLKLLRPTIRKDNSELWFSWNPRHKRDPVDHMFMHAAPTDSVCVTANWRDNPWFSEIGEQERLDCLDNDEDYYEHIWEGDYETINKGAYFASQIADARRDGRISNLSPDPLMTIKLFADIGGSGAKSDNFVFWAAQFIGHEIRVINHYEVQGQALGHHMAWLREQGYSPDRAQIILPHDGATNDRVYDVSYESAFEQAGYKVEVIPNQGKGAAKARIEEVRRLFPQMWFDERKCKAGIEAVSWYHEKLDDTRQIGLGPDHDWSSHSADALGLLAVYHEVPVITPKAEYPARSGGWMSA